MAILEDSMFVDTPIELNIKYRKAEGDLLSDLTLYKKLVGSHYLLDHYAGVISCVVYSVSKSMESLQHLYLVTVRRIIQYLVGLPSQASSLLLHKFTSVDCLW